MLYNNQDLEKNISKFSLEGYLLFLGQNYKLDLACIVAEIILERFGKKKFLEQFIQFIVLNMDFDGSVGIINPLRNSVDKNQVIEWKYRNTYYAYLFFSDFIKN